MKTDRELLELAAKVAGIALANEPHNHGKTPNGVFCADASYWSPLTDDGDALRLAVKLRLRVCTPTSDDDCALASNGDVVVYSEDELVDQLMITDPYIATRRAIVRAAAALALQMLQIRRDALTRSTSIVRSTKGGGMKEDTYNYRCHRCFKFVFRTGHSSGCPTTL